MKTRCHYTVSIRPGFICLTDLNRGRSLTNDAEAVIADLVRQGYDLTNNRVIYRDTSGIWDELVVSKGAFLGYRSINASDIDSAIGAVKNRSVTLPKRSIGTPSF